MIGDRVFFNGKEFVIIYKYSSGYCEIKEIRNPYHYELALFSDLEKIHIASQSIIDSNLNMIEV